MSINQNKNQGS